MRIDYTVRIWPEDKQFVAEAMPLNVVSAAATPGQARAAVDEAVGLFLTTAQETGTLSEVLEECGYEFREGKWRAPEPVLIEDGFAEIGA